MLDDHAMAKLRAPIYLQCKYKDGSTTVAKTASIGLMCWFGRIISDETKIAHTQYNLQYFS
jgi:hypothetical protein